MTTLNVRTKLSDICLTSLLQIKFFTSSLGLAPYSHFREHTIRPFLGVTFDGGQLFTLCWKCADQHVTLLPLPPLTPMVLFQYFKLKLSLLQ